MITEHTLDGVEGSEFSEGMLRLNPCGFLDSLEGEQVVIKYVNASQFVNEQALRPSSPPNS